LCTPAERQLWERLSVFAGSFDLPGARHVCGHDRRQADFLDELFGLVDKSILIREEHDDTVRFRLLVSLREYGKARMAERSDYHLLARRHADWYQRLVEEAAAEWFSPHQLDWLGQLTREMPNIREALQFSLLDSPATALRMTAAMPPTWLTGRVLSEPRHWLDHALAATPPEPSQHRIRTLGGAALVACVQGDLTAAAGRIAEARTHLDVVGDQYDHCFINCADCLTALLGGEIQYAHDCVRDLMSRTDQPELRSWSMYYTAWAMGLAGHVEQALSSFEKALAITETHGDSVMRSKVLCSLGTARWLHGEPKRAEQLLLQGLQLSDLVDDSHNAAQCLEVLGWVALADNAAWRATVLMAAAEAVSRAVGGRLISFAMLKHVHDECERQTREQLGAADFQAAWRDGSALTLHQAVEVALAATTVENTLA
jgi:hypothetical protein